MPIYYPGTVVPLIPTSRYDDQCVLCFSQWPCLTPAVSRTSQMYHGYESHPYCMSLPPAISHISHLLHGLSLIPAKWTTGMRVIHTACLSQWPSLTWAISHIGHLLHRLSLITAKWTTGMRVIHTACLSQWPSLKLAISYTGCLSYRPNGPRV